MGSLERLQLWSDFSLLKKKKAPAHIVVLGRCISGGRGSQIWDQVSQVSPLSLSLSPHLQSRADFSIGHDHLVEMRTAMPSLGSRRIVALACSTNIQPDFGAKIFGVGSTRKPPGVRVSSEEKLGFQLPPQVGSRKRGEGAFPTNWFGSDPYFWSYFYKKI
jgi:hypothetical protein